jgi:hypothetical protein
MLCVVLGLGQIIINAQPLNTNDSLRVRGFLIQSSAVAGQSNGQQLNADFNASNPVTWSGFRWAFDSERNEMRLDSVVIANRSLAGNLNLNG